MMVIVGPAFWGWTCVVAGQFAHFFWREGDDFGEHAFLLFFFLALRLNELLDIKGEFKKPFLHALLLACLSLFLILLIEFGLVAGLDDHLFLWEDDFQIGLFDFILRKEVDFMDQVETNCGFKVLALERSGLVLDESGVQVVVLKEVILNEEDAVIAGPSHFALFLADHGVVEAEEREFFDDLIGEGEAELPHVIVTIIVWLIITI